MRYATALLLLCVLLLAGCSRPPTVQFNNLALVASLRTACSARNPEWLAGVERAVAARHHAGSMSDDEKTHFESLIARAKRGDWGGAEQQCYQFERAQLSRIRLDSPPSNHDHAHPEGLGRLSSLNDRH